MTASPLSERSTVGFETGCTDEEPGRDLAVVRDGWLERGEARRLTDEVKRDAQALWRKLLRLHDVGAHVALGYSSWHAYCEAEFGFGRSHSYRLLDAGRVGALVPQLGNESQARALVPLLDRPDELRDVVLELLEEHPELTAGMLRAAVERRGSRTVTAKTTGTDRKPSIRLGEGPPTMGWGWQKREYDTAVRRERGERVWSDLECAYRTSARGDFVSPERAAVLQAAADRGALLDLFVVERTAGDGARVEAIRARSRFAQHVWWLATEIRKSPIEGNEFVVYGDLGDHLWRVAAEGEALRRTRADGEEARMTGAFESAHFSRLGLEAPLLCGDEQVWLGSKWLEGYVVPIETLIVRGDGPSAGDPDATVRGLREFGQVNPVLVADDCVTVVYRDWIVFAAVELGWKMIAVRSEKAEFAEQELNQTSLLQEAELTGVSIEGFERDASRRR